MGRGEMMQGLVGHVQDPDCEPESNEKVLKG